MANEISRKMSVRRITAPDDKDTYVDLKVIDSIMFIDPKQHYQEWELSFANNPEANRRVHVVEVGEDKLKVERVDALSSVHNSGGRYQEWVSEYENNDNPPIHYSTHRRKIYGLNSDKTKNEDVWIEVQRIDKIWFKDPKEHNQERVWELVWPDNENDQWDYQDLATPTKDWDGTSINPPWRLDPFQTIVDCSLGGKYLLVLYGTNKIAKVSISDSGKFKLVSAKTLAQSSWGYPLWDNWFDPTNNQPKYFLKTAQLKVSKTLHALTVPLKISNGVITSQDNPEQRPVFNVADTIHKCANSTAPLTTNNPNNFAIIGVDGALTSGDLFTPIGADPIINGKDNYLYNEVLDKFEAQTGGIKRTEEKVFEPFANSSWWPTHGSDTPSSITIDGGRWGKPFYDHLTIYAPFSNLPSMTAGTRWYTGAQYDKWVQFLNEANPYGFGVAIYVFGPGDADFNGFYERIDLGTTLSVSTKVMIYSKTNGLDVIETPSVEWSISFNDVTATTVTNGISLTSTQVDDYFALNASDTHLYEPIYFPYQTSSGGMYYRISHLYTWDGQGYGEYHTPYETWSTPDIPHPPSYLDPYFQGWLQLSNGKRMIQGYLKNGQKRIFMDGVEAGTALAAAIKCDVNDIVTMFMDVKSTDISKLK